MAKIYLAQKFFTFKDGFNVFDEKGQVIYSVKTPLIALTTELSVDNAQGKKVAAIKKSMNPLFPGYNLFVNGQKIGRMYMDHTLLGSHLHITRLDWNIEGNLLGWSYKVKKGFGVVGRISVQPWHMSDHYAIEFDNEKDELPLLLVTLAAFLNNQEAEAKKNESKKS